MAAPSFEAVFLQGYRWEQLGLFANALKAYSQALHIQPDNLVAKTRHARLARDIQPRPSAPIKVIWQVGPDGLWERDWLRLLLSSLTFTDIIDGNHREFHDAAIVIDGSLSPDKNRYYQEMLLRGHRFGLIHISDEGYADDVTAYDLANFVIRNYWSPAHADNKRILAVPLGTLNDFSPDRSKPSAARTKVWSFAGEIGKSSRPHMLVALASFDRGFVHPAGLSKAHPAGDPVVSLNVRDYADLLSDTIFAPCPAGWVNLDSFRVCEALEAGCIPIVERRPSYDYFRNLFGDHPMITVADWKDAPGAMNALLQNPASLEDRRMACADWWQQKKRALVDGVRDLCTTGFGIANVVHSAD